MGTETRQQYEGAILTQLVKNAERLAVVETRLDNIEARIGVLETRLDNIETRIGVLEADISELKTDLAIIKPKIERIDRAINWVLGLLGAIAIATAPLLVIAVLANFFSQPLISFLQSI